MVAFEDAEVTFMEKIQAFVELPPISKPGPSSSTVVSLDDEDAVVRQFAKRNRWAM